MKIEEMVQLVRGLLPEDAVRLMDEMRSSHPGLFLSDAEATPHSTNTAGSMSAAIKQAAIVAEEETGAEEGDGDLASSATLLRADPGWQAALNQIDFNRLVDRLGQVLAFDLEAIEAEWQLENAGEPETQTHQDLGDPKSVSKKVG